MPIHEERLCLKNWKDFEVEEMGDKCEICKKNTAKIRIGNHSYCFDCHNKMALLDMGVEDTFEYAKTMSVIEPGGRLHTFEIEHVVLGGIVSWEANEKDGDYQFRLISNTEENGAVVAQKLFRKIVDGVCCKTLDEHTSDWGTSYQIKEKGNIRIIEDEDRDFDPAFEVDGKKFTPEEFADLFRGFVSFNMQFQIRDGSCDLLGENEYLVPVRITEQSLLEELETALAVTTDRGGFLSYKNVSAFDELFYKIVDKLRVIDDALDREKAQTIGRAIAKRLREVEHDDDWFPVGNIQSICEVVDPYGTDEELQKYLEGEE